MSVWYEWVVEVVATIETEAHAIGDVLDTTPFDTYADCIQYAHGEPLAVGTRYDVGVVRNDDNGRAWAYLDGGALPTHFADANDNATAKVPVRFHREVAALRRLDSYSDPLAKAPKTLRELIERDARIVAYTIEADGCFIYTCSDLWDDGNGAGTFREDTVTAAIADYKANVQRNTAGRQ